MLKRFRLPLAIAGFSILMPVTMLHASQGYSYQTQNNVHSLQAIINPPSNSTSTSTWMGADVGSSIKLTEYKYLWIFGDTLLGSVSDKSRIYNTMFHNSVGITHCNAANASCQTIQKYQSDSVSGVFTLENPNQYFWPTAGSQLNSKLFISGYNINSETADSPTSSGGTSFFLVDNPLQPPADWHYQIYSVPNTDINLNWATAAVKQGNWLYILGAQATNDTSAPYNTVVSRITLSNAEKGNWSKTEYWLKQNQWSKTFSSDTLASIQGLPGTTETAIGYNDYFKWYCVQILSATSYDAHLYTATNLMGPWVDQGIIYTIPKRWNSTGVTDTSKFFITYAAKVHPELASSNHEVVFTYNINTLNLQSLVTLIAQADYWPLYVPQVVAVMVNKKNSTPDSPSSKHPS
ncbi:MAG: hypothetical protein V4496_07825 [Pseudomonadota bacterium]